jgi:hypothetical protein
VHLPEHPAGEQSQATETTEKGSAWPQTLDREWLRQACLEVGSLDAVLCPLLPIVKKRYGQSVFVV